MGLLFRVSKVALNCVAILSAVLIAGAALAQERSSGDPVPDHLPIEDAMCEYNARFMVVSQTDGSGDYDATMPQVAYPWPASLGCGDGLLTTPPKPKDGWYGPAVYEDPEEALFLVRTIVKAFYEAEPVAGDGPLYTHFINPTVAIKGDPSQNLPPYALPLTESDFPLYWLPGSPVWANAGGINTAVTRQNYKKALNGIIKHIGDLAATGLGGIATDQARESKSVYTGYFDLHPPIIYEDDIIQARQEAQSLWDAKSGSSSGFIGCHYGLGVGTIEVNYTYHESKFDIKLNSLANYLDKTIAIYLLVDSDIHYQYGGFGPEPSIETQTRFPSGMWSIVDEEDYGSWTSHTTIDGLSASDLDTNGDYLFSIEHEYSDRLPQLPNDATEWSYNAYMQYSWSIDEVAFLVSKYPAFDDSPSPKKKEDQTDPENCCGDSPGAQTDQDSETGDPEFSVNAGSDEPGEESSQFYAEVDEPDPGIREPGFLDEQIAGAVSDGTNQHITDSNGRTLQIMNGDWNGGSPSVRSLVHFNTSLSNGYAIEFYGDANWDSTNSDWDPVGNAFRKVTIQDLSGASDGSHIRVSDATIDESTGSTVDEQVTDYTWDATNKRWVMAEGVNPSTGVAKRKRWVEVDTSSGKTITRMVTSDNTSEVVSKVVEVYSVVGGVERITERSTLSNTTSGDTSLVETWLYYANGNLQRYSTDRGDWVYYEYDAVGAVSKMVRSLDDEGEFDPTDSNGNEPGNLVTTRRDQYTDLSDTHTNDGVEVIRETIELIEDEANPGTMIPVSTTYAVTWSYDTVNGTEYELWEIVCSSPDPKAGYTGADDEAKTTAFLNALVADADYLGHYVTKSVFATPGEDYRFKMVRTEYPDGTVSLRDRSEAGSVRTRVSERGFPSRDVNGNITGIVHGTRHTTTIDSSDGSMTLKLERIVRGGNWITISYSETTDEDSLGRPTDWGYYYGVKAASPGTNTADYSSAKVFSHHGVSSQTDRRGLTTETEYDSLGQPTRMDINVGTSGALRIETDYDPAGRVVATYRQGLDSLGATTTAKLMDQQFVFDEAGRLSNRTDGAGVKMFYTYNRVAEDGSSYVVGTSTGPMYEEQRVYPHDRSAGPINVTRYNRLGQQVMQYQAKPTSPTYDWNGAAPSATEALTPLSRMVYEYDWRGVQIAERTYFEIASLGGLDDEGVEGTNYLRTEILAIDHLGSLLRETDETGTISAYVYDSAGRLLEEWLGTDDTGATASDPSGTGTNNMVLVVKHFYDDDRDGTGDPVDYRTRLEYINPIATLGGSSDFTGIDYELLLAADSETGWSKPDHGPWSASTQTHDDRVTEVIDTANGSTTTLLSKRTWQYDTANNRPWRLDSVRSYEISAGSSAYVETSYEYDDADRQNKEIHARGGFTVTNYDDLGRSWRFLKHADANTVLTQDETIYDNADRAVAVIALARYHDDTTTVGPLSKTISVLNVLVNRYDSGGRLERMVDFGQDNGSTRYVFNTQGGLIDADSDGIPDEAEASSALRAPNTSDDYRVSVTTFDERGLTKEMQRNDGRKTRYSYDAMSRRVEMIENYVDGTPGTAGDDSDRITKWTFNSVGQPKTVEAQLATGTIQTQTFVYSSELTDKGSPVSRNDLLRALIHADSDDSVANGQLNDNADGYDREEYTYTADGRSNTFKDRRGITWQNTYTDEGWLDTRSAISGTTLASGDTRRVTRLSGKQQRMRSIKKPPLVDTAISIGDLVRRRV